MGSVSNLPLKEDNDLYLLCLVPETRSGQLLHQLSEHERLLLEVRENRGLLHYEYQAFEPGALAAVAIALVLIALGASWLPARRASGIDPVDSLRSE